ncbi:DUF3310 domain-containing protein [Corynebacterium pygosceleis]|uniref:DUF3310 domain-containing protein n=1 Tax=Corynebacterium pygosceleis TaxID=2800406 RepID=UPI002005DFC0|nr:DUF3310 domain-containing protein [Corynebacterium pygosceleis]MCK7676404.1 DUF3310 domain-containing protein [Corynebacterium pygosceleis]
MPDLVNHPPHYAAHPFLPGECIDYTRHMGFVRGNAFKYLWRAGAKGNTVQDLEKALWYLHQLKTGDCADPDENVPGAHWPLVVEGSARGLASIAAARLIGAHSHSVLNLAIANTKTAIELARKENHA